MADVLVIGAGVVGLTCALRLTQAGAAVRVVARELPPRTTSNVAGALWYPYAVGPKERVDAWARSSYDEFRALSSDPATGVMVRRGIELFREPAEPPALTRGLPGFREARRDELRAGFRCGWIFEAPVIETSIYLAWLQRELDSRGVAVAIAEMASLEQALALAPSVIDCAGLGARELARDPGVHAIRGQILRVERCGVEEFALDDYGPEGITYVIPRSRDCVLGGTAEDGREDVTPDPAQSAAILRRAIALEPRLANARILSVDVGLRPARPTVRLEVEPRDGAKRVVHCYGHGGAGVTLSWGCADEVVELLQRG
jgi:D-amino-acid oxidase